MCCAFVGLVALALVACGDDDRTDDADAGDAVVDDASDDAAGLDIAPPAPVAAALPPVLLPCPEGWVERATPRGVAYCDPYRDGIDRCEGATAQRPGEPACVPIGPPCPEGMFPADVPSDRPILYVQVGAVEGDGTEAHPFATIAEALGVATDGAIVALSRGEHVGSVSITRSVELRGACAEETRIVADEGVAALAVEGPVTLALRGLHVVASASALRVMAEASVEARGVMIESNDVSALSSFGELVSLEDSIIRVTQAEGGGAIRCYEGACVLRDVMIDTASEGVSASGARIEIDRTSIRVLDAAVSVSSGINVGSGAQVDIRELAIHDEDFDIVAGNANVIVDRAYLGGDGRYLGGIIDGTTELSRVFAEGGRTFGATGEVGDSVTLRDVILLGAADVEDVEEAPAVFVSAGGTLRIERLWIEGGEGLGVLEASASGSDLTILDTRGTRDPMSTTFAFISQTGEVDLERVAIERAAASGALFQVGGHARLRDLRLYDIGVDRNGIFGLGAILQAEVTIERATIERARTASLIASGGGVVVTGRDVAIADTLPFEPEGDFGRGVVAEDGAIIDLERARVERSRGHGVLALRARVVLRHMSLIETAPLECAATSCRERPFGMGIGGYHSDFVLEDFEVRRSTLCGLYFATGSTVEAQRGLVSQSALGLCVDDSPFDAAALGAEVVFVDNDVSFDALVLPVPDPLPPIAVPEL